MQSIGLVEPGLELLLDGQGHLQGQGRDGLEQHARDRVIETPAGDALTALRDKAKHDHAEVDPWLSKLPSAAASVREIADALERVARRLP